MRSLLLQVAVKVRNFPKSGKNYSTAVDISEADLQDHSEVSYARPYSEVPGPQGLPFIGNSWRFLPIIGNYSYFFFHLPFKNLFIFSRRGRRFAKSQILNLIFYLKMLVTITTNCRY